MNTQHTFSGLIQSDTTESKPFCADPQDTTSTISEPSVDNQTHQKQNSNENPNFTVHLEIISKDTIFEQNGYKKISKICDTSQGELYKAYQLSNQQYVAIKRTNKSLCHQSIAIQDEMTFCVSENVIKEALILQYLTVDNKCIGGYIVQFLNFFQSDTDYYLVMEYIESETNLKQFVKMSHQYMKQGKLKLKDYQKAIKYLHWQLSVTIQWLHDSMNCCHLDLCLDNIMLANCKFMLGKDGYYKINGQTAIRLVDFGVSEMFSNGFECSKQGLSLDNEPYLAPKVYSDEIYNAPSADMWSLGMVLYECITGKGLYNPMEIWQYNTVKSMNIPLLNNGYWSTHNNELKSYVALNNIRTFTCDSFDLVIHLLSINEDNRLNAMGVLMHKWFKPYYNNYHRQIEKKARIQKEKLEKQKHKLRNFPFYKMMQFP